MHHHISYSPDSVSQSHSLASLILSASAPPQISSACSAIDSFLSSHSPDHSRHFFFHAFPSLICKLFGFDDAPPHSPIPSSSPSPSSAAAAAHHGWIDTIISSNDSDLASRVFALLSPDGPLMSSIAAVDRLGLVRYLFPTERLPEWTRYMLLNDRDSSILADHCPLFKGKVREDSIKGSFCQVQLNVFEYYMFWFAYYPVCRGNSENVDAAGVSKKSKASRLENWACSIPVISSVKRGKEHSKTECNLYMRLLYANLRAFVPIDDLTAHQPYRSSLLHYPTEYDGSILALAQFLVDSLVNYWLVDNDFSPVSMSVCKSFGVTFPFRSVLGETPPTTGLGEVVKLFVKYLNLSLVKKKEASEGAECASSPVWIRGDPLESRDMAVNGSPSDPVGSWNSLIQRPLYRYILRTFLFCPVETSMKNVSQVFSVWVSYIEPWAIRLDDFSELGAPLDSKESDRTRNEASSSCVVGYSLAWQDYVLSNYLYYTSMVMHFIGFAHKFLHTDPEVIVQMVLKIMNTLVSSKELIDLIKNVFTLFHTNDAGINKPTTKSLYRYIPSIGEQLQDWEDGLCESDADGSFLHENWNKDLRLFSDGEDGGKHLLQLFILRAEAELQATSRDSLGQNLQLIDTLKNKIGQLFGGNFPEPVKESLVNEPQRSKEVFSPRRTGKQGFGDVKFRGDWMQRPVSDDEIAWLAKLLVQLSAWVNNAIGLDRSENPEDGSRPSYVEVPAEVGTISGPLDTARALLWAVGSWLLVMSSFLARLMRKHGLRVNLRILASKKIVMVVVAAALFAVLRRALGVLCNV